MDTPGRSLCRRASWPTVTHVGIVMPQESSDVVIVGALVLVGTASTPGRGAGAVAVSRGYRGVMRVYELARELGITSATLVSQLRAEGEWVDSHRSSVPVPVQLRYLSVKGVLSPSLPAEAPRRDPNQWPAWSGPRVRWRRRPGPERIARYTTTNRDQLEQWNDLDLDLISTRDVAEYLKVQPATVRQWAKRGYIRPVGTIGPANLFSRRQVAAARPRTGFRQHGSRSIAYLQSTSTTRSVSGRRRVSPEWRRQQSGHGYIETISNLWMSPANTALCCVWAMSLPQREIEWSPDQKDVLE